MTTKKTAETPRTSAEIRADIDAMQTQLGELRKAERRAKRAEAKAAREAKARADRALADELLAAMRELAPGADDALLVPALRRAACLPTRGGRPLLQWAVEAIADAEQSTTDADADADA